jgi:putative transposase
MSTSDKDINDFGEWYSRGYLPHCDQRHLFQSVTFRLRDSLPQEKLRELELELKSLPETERDQKNRQKIEHWLDAGLGCCTLRHAEAAQIVQEVLTHFHSQRYHLIAWVIMPNHVHIVVEPMTPLAKIVQTWKSVSARRLLAKNETLSLGLSSTRRVWMRDYWDRYIRDEKHLRAAVDYIHQNPVKAGLCERAVEWPWSSARKDEDG